MNIFYLHNNPSVAAQMHCDKHVCKMILETAQMMSAVHARYGMQNTPYKVTHAKHPSTLWAGDSQSHYMWLAMLGLSLCREYTERYGKVHKTEKIIKQLWLSPKDIPNNEWVDPPKCMPDEYKIDDTVASYREYYRKAKAHFAKWKKGNVPDFMTV